MQPPTASGPVQPRVATPRPSDRLRSHTVASTPNTTKPARTDAILRAVFEELAVVGYRALRIEDVAARAGVNKTTIYRRWPTKLALIQAALEAVRPDLAPAPDTGSIRGDLVEIGKRFVAQAGSVEGQCLFRVMAVELAESELREFVEKERKQGIKSQREIFDRAVARGELDPKTDMDLLFTTLMGGLHLKLFFLNERADEIHIIRIVDFLLNGAALRRGT